MTGCKAGSVNRDRTVGKIIGGHHVAAAGEENLAGVILLAVGIGIERTAVRHHGSVEGVNGVQNRLLGQKLNIEKNRVGSGDLRGVDVVLDVEIRTGRTAVPGNG